MNPSTAFGISFTDELVRCGLREVVLAPGSRSTPLAMAFCEAERRGLVRLHVRIDERSASFTALGLAKANRQPVAVLCTSGTAAANFHPAVIEADESGVPLLVLTADRPPEMRGTGANQVIDQVKLYGSAVRWFCEAGRPRHGRAMVGYWRSLACQAWAHASGHAGSLAGPVHLNLAFREPLVPGGAEEPDWPEPLDGRPDGRPWTSFEVRDPPRDELEVPWTERGVVVCGDGDYDAVALTDLAGGRLAGARGTLVRSPARTERAVRLPVRARHARLHGGAPPDLIVSAGRRAFPSAIRPARRRAARRHVVIAQGPGRWADPQRAATDVASAVRLTGAPGSANAGGWLADWRRADDAARRAVDAVLDDDENLTEPRLARDLANHLPEGRCCGPAQACPFGI